jgi:hypothetical protein
MKLYLSEFKCDFHVNRHQSYSDAINSILKISTIHNFNCYRSEQCSGYDEIEREIFDSSFFIAVIDEYWVSSTWKSHEFTFASGGISLCNESLNGPNLPKIVFILPETKHPEFIQESADHICLTYDIKSFLDNLNFLLGSIKSKDDTTK